MKDNLLLTPVQLQNMIDFLIGNKRLPSAKATNQNEKALYEQGKILMQARANGDNTQLRIIAAALKEAKIEITSLGNPNKRKHSPNDTEEMQPPVAKKPTTRQDAMIDLLINLPKVVAADPSVTATTPAPPTFRPF